MSTFTVPVVRIDALQPIAGADAIEAAVVAGYLSVVRKGDFAAGDTAVYLPEGALLPQAILEAVGLWDAEKGKGKLAGSGGDRVKAARLRGCLSQGILYRHRPAGGREEAPVGTDLASELGVEKYEPKVPASMSGELFALVNRVVKFDVENLKAHPGVLVDGEEVVATEKLHGTCTLFGFVPGMAEEHGFLGGDAYVASKGLGAKGFVFKDSPANDHNVYVRGFRAADASVRALMDEARASGGPLHVMGETFGAGIQDLAYGLKGTELRMFAAYAGAPGTGRWLDYDEREALFARVGLRTAALLYRGPYSRDAIAAVRDGPTVEGNGAHIREGVVVTPAVERRDQTIGRVVLKDVSAAYLLRKGENATEFQ
jgi:RNA ligase (TIGR02306 family)